MANNSWICAGLRTTATDLHKSPCWASTQISALPDVTSTRAWAAPNQIRGSDIAVGHDGTSTMPPKKSKAGANPKSPAKPKKTTPKAKAKSPAKNVPPRGRNPSRAASPTGGGRKPPPPLPGPKAPSPAPKVLEKLAPPPAPEGWGTPLPDVDLDASFSWEDMQAGLPKNRKKGASAKARASPAKKEPATTSLSSSAGGSAGASAGPARVESNDALFGAQQVLGARGPGDGGFLVGAMTREQLKDFVRTELEDITRPEFDEIKRDQEELRKKQSELVDAMDWWTDLM